MRHYLLAFSLLISGYAIAQNSSNADEINLLKKLSVEWMDAWKNKDSIKLEQILAPEYRLVYAAPSIQIAPRNKWLETALHYYNCEWFHYTDFDVRVYGNTAIVQSIFETKANWNGTDRSGKYVLTDVWVKKINQWQVVHRHSSFQTNK